VRRIKDFYTINPDLYSEFINHIEINNLNKSKIIEHLISEYIKREKTI